MAVHTDAETLIPLADLKNELGITAGDAGYDSDVQGYRAAALKWIESVAHRAPLKVAETLVRCLPRGDAFLVISPAYDRTITAATPIRYWTPGQEAREAPGGSITLASLGRRARSEGGVSLFVYPPAGGWPDAVNERMAEIDVDRAWNMTEGERESVRGIVVLWARGMFTREDRHFTAAEKLIRPLAWY